MDISEAKGVEIHNGYLRIAIRPPGYARQIRRSLGWKPTSKNIQAAFNKKIAIDREIAMGHVFNWEKHFPNDKLAKAKLTPLFSVMDIFYDAYKAGWKYATRKKYLSRMNTLQTFVKDVPFVLITPQEAKVIWGQINNYDSGYVLKNQFLSVIVRTGYQAVLDGIIESNPFSHLPRFVDIKLKQAEEAELTPLQVYTEEEADLIIRQIELPHIKRYVTFLFWTGIRPGEAAALKRTDVILPTVSIKRTLNKDGGTGTPKTKAGIRKITLPEKAQEAISEQLKSHDNDRVWLTLDNHVPNNGEIVYNKYWRKIVKLAGLRYLKPYVTRHSFASWVLKRGEEEYKVAQHLGHRNVTMIRNVYGHFIPDKDKKWSL